METKIKVNDTVQVTDWGNMYDISKLWFEDHINEIKFDWVIRYAYGDTENYKKCQYTDNNAYVVLYVDEREEKALISLYTANTKVYLINVNDLVPVKVMTMEQIVEEFGYRIKIIES